MSIVCLNVSNNFDRVLHFSVQCSVFSFQFSVFSVQEGSDEVVLKGYIGPSTAHTEAVTKNLSAC